jgi:uncharacterized membrane protein
MAAAIGACITLVGLLLIVLGAVLAHRAEGARIRDEDRLRGAPEAFVSSLADLVRALADHPVGIRLVVLGIVVRFSAG